MNNEFKYNALTVKSERKRNIVITSEQIERQIEEFISNGGSIQLLASDFSADPKYRIDDLGFYDNSFS